MFWSLFLGLRTEENRFSESTELRDDSAESTEVHRFSPSLIEFYRVSNRSTPSLVSSNGIDGVRPESVTNRPSRTGLGRFFEPWCIYIIVCDLNLKITSIALFGCSFIFQIFFLLFVLKIRFS